LIVEFFLCRKKYALARRTIEMEVKNQIRAGTGRAKFRTMTGLYREWGGF
jgi:hypothetical protein